MGDMKQREEFINGFPDLAGLEACTDRVEAVVADHRTSFEMGL